MICIQCHKENRPIARYCKWCGKAIPQNNDPLGKLVGMESIKTEFRNIVRTFIQLRNISHTKQIRLNINSIIIGDTGTGKTTIPQILHEYLKEQGILEKSKLTIVDAVDFGQFVEHWDSNIKEAKGGILFFDNVQKLLPDSYSKNVNPLDKLFTQMDKWDNDPIVILAGLPHGLEEFLENNPSVRSRFKYIFRLPTMGVEEIYELTRRTLYERYSIEKISSSAKETLMRQIKYELKNKDEAFEGARHAQKKAEDIFTAYISNPARKTNAIETEDIPGYVPKIRTLEDILKELDDFIGMEDVKKTIREIAWEVQASVQRKERGIGTGENLALHIVLTGNPGTGKTSIARKMGEIFESIGFLPSDHVEEVDRSRMVSQYIGETPKLVDQLCDKAMGGILFIDEAYTLAPTNENGEKDKRGTQALEKLMKRMEDDRGRFVVIAAGYKNEMENLLNVNPGMRSRFNRFLHINDYNPEELYQILQVFAHKQNYKLSPEASKTARLLIEQIHACRNNTFANAREMRLLFEKMCTRHSERINRLPLDLQTNEILQTFEAEDIPYEKPETINYEDCLKGLDALIGLENVKEEVRTIVSRINMQIRRGEQATSLAGHYVFTGNPGTGKTTVARIMADVFKALGIATRGGLIEADRSKLVAGYTGQTAIKTNQLIDKALGGVLFIDEAYTLYTGEGDTFGKEALDTLLKRLEDDRGKFICIVAGYTKEMHDFIHSNPGLKSRFTKKIHFEDYSPTELTEIFINMVQKKNLVMDESAMRALQVCTENMYAMRGPGFGNAREIRTLFEQAVSNQSKRLSDIATNEEGQTTNNDLFKLTAEDITGEENTHNKTLDEVISELDEFIGMNSIKEAIRRLAVQVIFVKQRHQLGIAGAEPMALNIILTGNPGTGKTSIARKMAEVFKAIGLLPTNKIIETNRGQMIGKYMGETPGLVNSLCDQAMGGVLFIDEAYTLYDNVGGNEDKYGKEAVETLMKRMEDDKGKFVVIAAGYRKEMDKFIKNTSGLESRFTHQFNIDDYTESELVDIFKSLVKRKQYILSESAEVVLKDLIHELCLKKDRNFGNAHEIEHLFDKTISKLSMRVASIPTDRLDKRDYQVIEPQDLNPTD